VYTQNGLDGRWNAHNALSKYRTGIAEKRKKIITVPTFEKKNLFTIIIYNTIYYIICASWNESTRVYFCVSGSFRARMHYTCMGVYQETYEDERKLYYYYRSKRQILFYFFTFFFVEFNSTPKEINSLNKLLILSYKLLRRVLFNFIFMSVHEIYLVE